VIAVAEVAPEAEVSPEVAPIEAEETEKVAAEVVA